ncbi:MAG: hypothetical protein HPZ97_02425 [Oscillospiraceae bacterium]|nr:hypothetical protein [Oscillospiraceae bacterium]
MTRRLTTAFKQRGLPQKDFPKSIEAPSFSEKLESKRLKNAKSSAPNLRGRSFASQKVRCFFVFILFFNVLIGLTQQSTRCSDGSSQAHEDLIAGFSAIEAEAELVQVRLKVTVKPPRVSA